MVILLELGFPDIYQELLWLPVQLAMLVWYPVASLLNMILKIVNFIYVPFAVILNGIIALMNNVLALPEVILVNFLPSIWVTIIVSILMFILALRLYSFLKGITIFGFRLGG